MSATHSKESPDSHPLEIQKILHMNPGELVTLMKELDEEGELEEFLDKALENDQLIAQLSYWEKWFPEKIRKQIDTRIQAKRKDLMARQDCLPLDLESKFTPEELKYLFSKQAPYS